MLYSVNTVVNSVLLIVKMFTFPYFLNKGAYLLNKAMLENGYMPNKEKMVKISHTFDSSLFLYKILLCL